MRSFAPAAVPCARLPAAAAQRVAATPLARLVARPSAAAVRLGGKVRSTVGLVLRAADTDTSGYESANDDNVQSGKGTWLRPSVALGLSDGCTTEWAGAQLSWPRCPLTHPPGCPTVKGVSRMTVAELQAEVWRSRVRGGCMHN